MSYTECSKGGCQDINWNVLFYELLFCEISVDDDTKRPKVRKVKIVDENIPKVDREDNEKLDFDSLVDIESGGN